MSTTRRKRTYFSLATFSTLIVVFFLNAGRILVENAPQNADVIVVLAGETDHRPALGLELLKQGYASRMILDVPAWSHLYNVSEIDVARSYVQTLPEAPAVEICPIEGLSTLAETTDVERCLAGKPSSRVLIVTSDFHTRRALSIFRHQLPGHSFSIAAARDDKQFGIHWWAHRQWAKVFLEEWLRFIWWNAVDLWR